jgi:glutathione S-transferase
MDSAAGGARPARRACTAMSELPTLWHFRISHFNEKVRWGLDWKRLPHRRRAVLPGPHIPVIWWHTGQKQVPVLRLDGTTIVDSTRILAALEIHAPEPPLYPSAPAARTRALALEEYFDEELGPHIRRAFFHEVLQDAPVALATLTVDEPWLTRRLYGLAFPLVRTVMRADMGIDAARSAESRACVEAALDRVAAELQPSGYLVGDRFSVADRTAAALLAPLVRAPEFPYALPPLVPALAAWRARLATHPAFEWAEAMYHRHRGVSAEVHS